MADRIGSVSVVVEWENAADLPDQTALANIRNLSERIVEASDLVRGLPVLVMASDPLASSRQAFDAVVADLRRTHAGHLEIVGLDTPGSLYVDQKIAGVQATETDVVAFADSDCHYRKDWLIELLRPFGDPSVDYAHGRNYMMVDDLWGQAAAVYWFYPIVQERPASKPGIYFNNLALRREAYQRYPFPGHPGNRLACAIWCRDLQTAGLKGVTTDAIADHPPAYGLTGVYRRAREYGRIDDGRYAARGFGRPARLLRAVIRLGRELLHSGRRSVSVAVKLRPSPARWLAMVGIATVYSVMTGLWQIRAALGETPTIPAVGSRNPFHQPDTLVMSNRG